MSKEPPTAARRTAARPTILHRLGPLSIRGLDRRRRRRRRRRPDPSSSALVAVVSVSYPFTVIAGGRRRGNSKPGMSKVPCRKKSYVHPEHTPTVFPSSRRPRDVAALRHRDRAGWSSRRVRSPRLRPAPRSPSWNPAHVPAVLPVPAVMASHFGVSHSMSTPSFGDRGGNVDVEPSYSFVSGFSDDCGG